MGNAAIKTPELGHVPFWGSNLEWLLNDQSLSEDYLYLFLSTANKTVHFLISLSATVNSFYLLYIKFLLIFNINFHVYFYDGLFYFLHIK